jgi:hypothetical protein
VSCHPCHSDTTIACSRCGLVVPAQLDLSALERKDWDQARLEGEWRFCSSTERDLYADLLETAKPFETEPLQAANVAMAKVMELRRTGAIRRAVERAQGRELGALEVA